MSIGGGQADNYPVWSDTKIAFQLGSAAATGNITITTSEGTSNGVSFTVRAGNIYFVDDTSLNDPGAGTFDNPWRSPASAITNCVAGDTVYIRAGAYNESYGSSASYGMNFGSNANNGIEANPIAYCGYQGELAQFTSTAGDLEVCIGLFKNYYVFSNLGLAAGSTTCVIYGTGNRIIGNDCTWGTKAVNYGGIQTFANATNIYIWISGRSII